MTLSVKKNWYYKSWYNKKKDKENFYNIRKIIDIKYVFKKNDYVSSFILYSYNMTLAQ